MVWVVIALIAALAIAPVMWMLPSPGDQRLARMRQRAMQLGLRVKACKLPQTHRQKVRCEEERPGVAYILAIPQPVRQKPAPRWFLWRREAGEVGAAPRVPTALQDKVRTALDQMPANVIAMERDGAGIVVYWRESLEITDVDRIADGMKELAKLQGIGTNEGKQSGAG